MIEKPYYTNYAVALTLILRDDPQALQILLYILWRRWVETDHPDGEWHIQIPDIARMLGNENVRGK